MDFLSSKIQVFASGFSNRPSSPEVEKKKKKKKVHWFALWACVCFEKVSSQAVVKRPKGSLIFERYWDCSWDKTSETFVA